MKKKSNHERIKRRRKYGTRDKLRQGRRRQWKRRNHYWLKPS
jgi:hypothetical protein